MQKVIKIDLKEGQGSVALDGLNARTIRFACFEHDMHFPAPQNARNVLTGSD
jgi:hypothetical protein